MPTEVTSQAGVTCGRAEIVFRKGFRRFVVSVVVLLASHGLDLPEVGSAAGSREIWKQKNVEE